MERPRRPTASVIRGKMPITLPDAEHIFAMPASQSGLASREDLIVPIMSGMGRSSKGKRRAERAGRF